MEKVQEDVRNVFEGKSVPINFADVVATQSASKYDLSSNQSLVLSKGYSVQFGKNVTHREDGSLFKIIIKCVHMLFCWG